MPVISSRDCLVTRSASLYSIRQGSQVYDTLLGEFSKGHGDIVADEHCVSSADRWSIRENHTGFRGHDVSMRHKF